jgi:NADH-quinone oxidoreductase subunit G
MAGVPEALVCGALLDRLGLQAGVQVRVSQGEASTVLTLGRDDRLADGVVRVPAAHPATVALSSRFGSITVERV